MVLTLKALVWAFGLFPLARLGWWLRDGLGGLGANPIERVLHHTGWWALVMLVATLAVTPLRRLTGRNELIRTRRPLGLFAFFYATLHLGVYLGLDQVFEWEFILEDVLERPFITVGMAAWLLLVPLAVTSTKGWIRRLGRRWTLLHRAAYLATVLGVIHFYWRVKADTSVPLIFAAAFVAHLALRMRWTARRRPRRARPPGREARGASHGDEGSRPTPRAGRQAGAGAGAR
jgi:sulfoxide reductase heme-binding subunit YedZ